MFNPDFQIYFNTQDNVEFIHSEIKKDLASEGITWKALLGESKQLYLQFQKNHGFYDNLEPYQFALLVFAKGEMLNESDKREHIEFAKKLMNVFERLGCDTEFYGTFLFD